MRSLLFYAMLLLLKTVIGQQRETLRIPSSGDSCNVINLNIGRGEEAGEQIMGPQGRPGKRGSVGLSGSKGERGHKGEAGPPGIAPVINMAEITSAVLKALAAKTCQELLEVHGISETGYYQMRTNETNYATYKYCDFEIRNAASCEELGSSIGDAMKTGYYRFRGRSDFVHCERAKAGDCKDMAPADAKISLPFGGVFDIYSESWRKQVEVTCDLQTEGGGWTVTSLLRNEITRKLSQWFSFQVFQRRMDGSIDFYRNWDDYVDGFGNKSGEFWLGLETIYQLTKDGDHELRIDLTKWTGSTYYAKYGIFSISSRDDNYRLTVGDYSGTAGDYLGHHNNYQFSTKDADHDSHSSFHCAQSYKGAWWYYRCTASNLNGYYNKGPGTGATTGNGWGGLSYDYLKVTEMKFRRKE